MGKNDVAVYGVFYVLGLQASYCIGAGWAEAG